MITVKETVAEKIATTILDNYAVMDTLCSPHQNEWDSVNEEELTKMILAVLENNDESKL